MKKNILALVVCGLLTATGSVYAIDGAQTKDPMARVFALLDSDQRAQLQDYKNEHNPVVQAAVKKVLADQQTMLQITLAPKFDKNKTKAVMQKFYADALPIKLEEIEFINYVYNNIAKDSQKKEIQSLFEPAANETRSNFPVLFNQL